MRPLQNISALFVSSNRFSVFHSRFFTGVILAISALATQVGKADTTESSWNGGSTGWTTTGNWTNGVPSATTSAVFNSSFTGANQPTVAASSTAQGIWVASGVGKNVTLSGGSLTIGGTATLNGIANTGILLDDSGNHSLTISTPLTLGASTSFLVNNAGTLNISGSLATGGNTLTIGGNNTSGVFNYSGTSITGGGTINVGSSGTVKFTGNNMTIAVANLNVTSGTLQLGTGSAGYVTSGAGNFPTTTTVSSGATLAFWMPNNATYASAITDNGTVTSVGNSSVNQWYNLTGVIGGTGNFIQDSSPDTVNGASDLTYVKGQNTYTGTTTVKSGILAITYWANGGSASGLGASSNAASNLVLNGGVLANYGGSNGFATTDRLFTLGPNGGTIDVSSTSTTVNLFMTNTGAIGFSTPNTTETLTLQGTKGVTNHGTITGPGNVNYYNLFDPQIKDNGTAATSLVKAGTGTWVVGGNNNTYTGGTTVSGGALQAQTANSLGSGAINVSNGAAVILNYAGTAYSTGYSEFSSSNLDSFISSRMSGFAAGSTLGIDPTDLNGTSGTGSATATVYYDSDVTLNNVNLARYSNTGNYGNVANLVLDGNLSLGTGGFGVYSTLGSNATTELLGNNTYTGATVLNPNNGSTVHGGLVLGSTTALGNASGPGTSAISVVSGANISLDTSALGTSQYVINAPIQFNAASQAATAYGLELGQSGTAGSGNFNFTGGLVGSNQVTGVYENVLSANGASSTVNLSGNIYINNGAGASNSSAEVLDFYAQNSAVMNVTGNIADVATAGTGVGYLSIGQSGGTVNLSGNNTYTGNTTLYRGNIGITSFGSIGSSGNLGAPTTTAAATITLGGPAGSPVVVDTGLGETSNRPIALASATNDTIDQSGASGTLTLTGGIAGLNYGTTGTNTLIIQGSTAGVGVESGVIADSPGTSVTGTLLQAAGSGQSYLYVANASGLFSTGVTVSATTGGTGTVSGIVGDYVSLGGQNLSSALAAGSVVTFGGGAVVPTGVTKKGTGTWILSGNNSYTGSTTVSNGILNIQNSNALGSTTVGTSVASGATLQLQGGISVGNEALTIAGTGAGGTNPGTGALENVSGTNTYGGLLTLTGATTISSDAGSLALSNTGTITGAADNVTLTGAGNGSISSVIGTTTGSLSKTGTGAWTLAGINTYTGTTKVSAGTLNVTGSLASGSAVTIGGQSGGGATATLSGTGTISGSLTTSSANSNVGHIAPGTPGTGNVGTLYVGSLGFTVGNNTQFDFDLSNTPSLLTSSDLISMAGGSLSLGSGIVFNFNQLSTLATGTAYTLISDTAGTISGFNAANFSATGIGSDTATFSIQGGALVVTFTGAAESTNYYFTGANSNDFTAAGNYKDAISGGNVHSTALSSTSDVYLAANGATNLPATVGSNNVSIDSLTFNTSTALNGSGTVTLVSSGTALADTATGGTTETVNANISLGSNQSWSVSNSSNTLAVTGGISGSGKSLTLTGGGTFNFTNGSNSYSGGTTVNQGTKLFINNTSGTSALGSGALTVQQGATFGGKGNASGLASFAIGSGGTGTTQVQVGAGGSDTTSNLTLAAMGASTIANANLTFNLNTAVAGQANQLDVGTTGITFGSNVALTLNLVGANIITANTPYVLIAGTGSGAGLNSSQFLGLTSSGTINGNTILSNFTLSFTGSQPPSWYSNSYVFLSANGQDIEVEVVPEPGTWALILGGFGVLFFWQRRKARQIQ